MAFSIDMAYRAKAIPQATKAFPHISVKSMVNAVHCVNR